MVINRKELWEYVGRPQNPAIGPVVYIAGPMTGIPEFNFPAFNAVAKRFREQGYEVLNPAENDGGDTSKPWAYYMRQDLKMVADADAIVVLPGWRNSKGATLEVHIAQQLGMPVLDAETLEPVSETILEEAQRLVHGDRGEDYGHPYDDFSRTARIWSAILGIDVTPQQVALCMIGLKISREVHRPKRDNRTDIAGYAETLDMVVQRAADLERETKAS